MYFKGKNQLPDIFGDFHSDILLIVLMICKKNVFFFGGGPVMNQKLMYVLILEF